MPRLNYGTLLENIVVVEANRLAFECLSEPEALGFATSFAMPPLTQCWCKLSEEASNSSFNGGRLQMLARQASPSGSLQAMWTLCVANGPGLPTAGRTHLV
jgi:hypothetical protein